jgi:hypothetical protein
VLRRSWLFAAAAAVLPLAFGGCAVVRAIFPPRPMPRPRPDHVVLIAVDGLRQADIQPETTPHLALLKQDGAYAASLQSRTPKDRTSTWSEALTGFPMREHATGLDAARRSIFELAARANRSSLGLVRTDAMSTLVPAGCRRELADTPSAEQAGRTAGAALLSQRPALLFIELSDGSQSAADCDAGLREILAAVRLGGLTGRTTVVLISGAGPEMWWATRGPTTRHGRLLQQPVSAADTAPTVARLLGIPMPARAGRVVAEAFRPWSSVPAAEGERRLRRGIVTGRIVDIRGKPMREPSVLLVRNEPPDGIRERWTDAAENGAFRFENIPAGRYDYVFVFDNLPCRVHRSLLVRRDVEVPSGAELDLTLRYERLPGADSSARPRGLAKSAARFLTDDRLAELREAARRETRPGRQLPLLALDALQGRRARTAQIREWLLASLASVRRQFAARSVEPEAVQALIDLAVAYDVNRASGLLTNTEDGELRDALAVAAEVVIRSEERNALRARAAGAAALGAVVAALHPSSQSDRWLSAANRMFERELAVRLAQVRRDPVAANREAICSLIEYAMIRQAVEGDEEIDERLREAVRILAAVVPPADRHTRGESKPDAELGFLGLGRAAFAAEELGSRLHALWEQVGRPTWEPNDGGSILGTLLTRSARPGVKPALRPSARLSESAAVLTYEWGTPREWMIVVRGWDLDLHTEGARLAQVRSKPPPSRPQIVRFRSSPAYDYVLIEAGPDSDRQFRHVLFNKPARYVVVSDELEVGTGQRLSVGPAVVGTGSIRGSGGQQAIIRGIGWQGSGGSGGLEAISTSARPSLLVLGVPEGGKIAPTEFVTWNVTETNLVDNPRDAVAGTHLRVTSQASTDLIRLGRTRAQVAGNLYDATLDGCVAVLRATDDVTWLHLILANWIQWGLARFALERGHGCAAIRSRRVDGWSDGRGRDVSVGMEVKSSDRAELQVDGRKQRVERDRRNFDFYLRAGPHHFRLEFH